MPTDIEPEAKHACSVTSSVTDHLHTSTWAAKCVPSEVAAVSHDLSSEDDVREVRAPAARQRRVVCASSAS